MFDVPAGLGEHVVTGRGERNGVGALTAGHETERCVRGQPSRSFSQPPATSSTTAAPGEVNALKAGWSHPTRQHVRGCRRIEGATDHEPEIAGTGRGDQGRLDGVRPARRSHCCGRRGPSGSELRALRRASRSTPFGNTGCSATSGTIARGARGGIGQQFEKRIHTRDYRLQPGHELADCSSLRSSSRVASRGWFSRASPGPRPCRPWRCSHRTARAKRSTCRPLRRRSTASVLHLCGASAANGGRNP